MKKIALKAIVMQSITAIFAMLSLLPVISSAAQIGTMPGSHVYLLSGEVTVTQGSNPAHPLVESEPLVSDTLIDTGEDSSALLRFEDGQIVTIQSNSTFIVREYRYDSKRIGNSSILFSLHKGGAHFVTGLIGERNKDAFRLLTPNATINIGGTDFMVGMVDGTVYSHVLSGKIRMTNNAGTSTIDAGESAAATTPDSPVATIPVASIPAGTFRELLSLPVPATSNPAPVPPSGAIHSIPEIPAASNAATMAATPAQTPASRVYVVNGTVSVAKGTTPPHQVTGDETIASGTMINTGDDSAALLKFEDGEVVTMQANSAFQVTTYHYEAKNIGKSSIDFSMFKGAMRFITGKIGQQRKQAFRLTTPNATIGIRGTDFMVAMVDDSVYSQVISGDIIVENTVGAAVISASQTAAVASAMSPVVRIEAAAIPAGTFTELPSIPVDPAAIPVPAAVLPVPVTSAIPDVTPLPEFAPVAATVPVPEAPPATEAIPVVPEIVPLVAAAPEPEVTPAPESVPAPAMEKSRSGVGLAVKIGTLGPGAELSFGSSDSFSARVGFNTFKHTYTSTVDTNDYEFKLKLQTVSVLADWYPFSGRFRTTGGVFYDNNKFTLTALAGSGGFTVGSTTYTGISSVQGTVSFNKIAPYFGIGWGNPVANGKGWGLVSDIGVMFQGRPKTELVFTCTSCPTASDVAEENAKLQNDLSNFKWWPVAAIGVSYQW